MIQLQALNALLSTRDYSWLTVNQIDDSYFSDYIDEFNFIQSHIKQFNKVPDPITFGAKFPDFDFIEVNETEKYIVDELYRDKNKRALARTFNKVRELINDGKTDEAISLYTNAASHISTATHVQAINLIEDTSRYDRYIERTQDHGKYHISTGFAELDEAIGGWDRLEELATIVARPGISKSWIGLKTAAAAAQKGLNVGLYSGEMTELKVGYRLDTLLRNVSNSGLMRGNIEIQNQYKVHIDNIRNFVKGNLWVTTPFMIGRTPTVSD